MHSVYKLYHNFELVYIGKSKVLAQRISTHEFDKQFDRVETFTHKDEKLIGKLENYLIYKYCPKLNSACNFNFRDDISKLDNFDKQFRDIGYVVNSNTRKFSTLKYLEKLLPDFISGRKRVMDYYNTSEVYGFEVHVLHIDYDEDIVFIIYTVNGKMLIKVKSFSKDVKKENKIARKINSKIKNSHVFLVFSNQDQSKWLDFPLTQYLSGLSHFNKDVANEFLNWLSKSKPSKMKSGLDVDKILENTKKELIRLQHQKKIKGQIFKYKKVDFYYQISLCGKDIRYHPVFHTFFFKKKSFTEDHVQKCYKCNDTQHAVNVFYKMVQK